MFVIFFINYHVSLNHRNALAEKDVFKATFFFFTKISNFGFHLNCHLGQYLQQFIYYVPDVDAVHMAVSQLHGSSNQ